MSIILQQLLVFYAFLVLGWGFGKWKKNAAASAGLLSLLLVNLFLPSKILETFSTHFTTAYIRENSLFLLVSISLLLIFSAIALVVARLLTKHGYERRVYCYSLTVSNYAYMGYALTANVFGGAALADLILFCIPFAIYTYTVGFFLLSGKRVTLKSFCHPMILSTAIGILLGLTGLQLPALIKNILSMSSACVGPISMLLTGLVLSGFSLRELVLDRVAYVVVALRLLILPLFVFGVCRLLGLVTVLPSAVLMACMPCGLNTVVFPKLVGEDCRPGARLAFISHILSVITLPIWLYILQ